MEKSSIKVTIMGSEYALKSEVDSEYVQELAAYVDQKMRKLADGSPVHAPLKIAVLTAVNISDELFRLKRKYDQMVKEIESTSQEITENVDTFLNQYSDYLK
jgi:cell division protein ZapA